MKKTLLYITGIIMILSLMGCGEKGSSEGILSNYRDDISWEMGEEEIFKVMGECWDYDFEDEFYTLEYKDQVVNDQLCDAELKIDEETKKLVEVKLDFTQDSKLEEVYDEIKMDFIQKYGSGYEEPEETYDVLKSENTYSKLWKDGTDTAIVLYDEYDLSLILTKNGLLELDEYKVQCFEKYNKELSWYMDKDQVIEILGEPDEICTDDMWLELLYRNYTIYGKTGDFSIFMNTDGKYIESISLLFPSEDREKDVQDIRNLFSSNPEFESVEEDIGEIHYIKGNTRYSVGYEVLDGHIFVTIFYNLDYEE